MHTPILLKLLNCCYSANRTVFSGHAVITNASLQAYYNSCSDPFMLLACVTFYKQDLFCLMYVIEGPSGEKGKYLYHRFGW